MRKVKQHFRQRLERKDKRLKPLFTRRMGVFIKYLLGKSITAKIEAVSGYWVNKVGLNPGSTKKKTGENYYEQIKRRKNNRKH